MNDENLPLWISAPRKVKAQITSLDQIPEGMVVSQPAHESIARGVTYTLVERQAQGCEQWLPIIMERVPADVGWSMGEAPGSSDQAELHRMFGSWVWHEVNYELPEATLVVNLVYIGLTGCATSACSSSDCTVMFDVTDSTGCVRRINVPI